MKIISHRANINGPNTEKENTPDALIYAIQQGYDVEIDLWEDAGHLYTGHDTPQYPISINLLRHFKSRLWIHAKNISVIPHIYDLRYFCIDKDEFTITSWGEVWQGPSSNQSPSAVIVMPELWDISIVPDNIVVGVCTDYPKKWKDILKR